MRPRADQFFTFWLVLKTAQDVHSQQLFPTFQRLLEGHEGPVGEVVRDLTRYADVFDSFDEFDPLSPDGKFFERMRELDVTTFYPLLMLLYALPEETFSAEKREETLRAIESWLARRAFCGWPTNQYNKIVPALIGQVMERPESAHDVVIGSLRGLEGRTAAWPTDTELLSALVEQPTYGRLRQSRVRMLLARVEGHWRRGLSEQLTKVGDLHIEHLLPQQWHHHWPLQEGDDPHLAAARRDEAKHMLGNLTLLTDKLNLKQSNQPWRRKRERLERHSVLLLNKRLIESAPDDWQESAIEERSRVLAEAATEVWPGPQSPRWKDVGSVDLANLELGASGAVELSPWQPSDGDLAMQLWMKIPRLAKRILAELSTCPDVSHPWEEIVRTIAPKRPKRVVPTVDRAQNLAAELGREGPIQVAREAGSDAFTVTSSVAELFRPIVETPHALQLTPAGSAQLDFWTEFAARAREVVPDLPLSTPKPSAYMGFSLTAPDTRIRGVVSTMDEEGSFGGQVIRACWILGKRRADEYLRLLEDQREQLHERLGFELAWPSASEAPPYSLCVHRPLDLYAPHAWDEPVDWMVTHVASLHEVAEATLRDVSVEAAPTDKEIFLEQAVDAFDRLGVDGAASFGTARSYRQVRIEGWPGSHVHFEFSVKKRRFVELHLENEQYAFLAPVLESMVGELAKRFPDARCEFDPRWCRCGRLRVILESDAQPEDVAQTMGGFICFTRDPVSEALSLAGDS